MSGFSELLAYKKGFELAMKIFDITKTFPVDEKFSLISQIRRSSRSVCANIAEAFGRRKYKKYFVAKLSDVQTENTETQVWLEFAKACKYITELQFTELKASNDEIGKLIQHMIKFPEKFM